MLKDEAPRSIPWDLPSLFQAPTVQSTPTEEPGVSALFYDGLPYQGQPTRIFAYYGVPKTSEGQKLPAMVLVHGGGGSAYAEWVRQWTARGYAAIAMDHCGNIPGVAPASEPYNFECTRTEASGPPGYGGFSQIDEPIEDHWTYHAVAAAILGHSLLRTFPEIDTAKIGLTGISWGGYLTSIIASLDQRFQFAVPVYGCGFITEDSTWKNEFEAMGEKLQRWNALWDPSQYLTQAKLPMLWKNGTNDFAYPLSSWKKSIELTQGSTTLSLEIEMPHGQHEGATPAEIAAYGNGILGLGPKLAEVGEIEFVGENTVKVSYQSEVPIVRAELNFTTDDGPWLDRKWQSQPAALTSTQAEAELPANTKAFFINLIDESGLIVSSQYETRANQTL